LAKETRGASSHVAELAVKAERMDEIRIGAVGAGGFGLFALQQFVQVQGVSLHGIAETGNAPALAMAQRFGARDFGGLEGLLKVPEVNLVYIATPPFLHFPQARAALLAGKHVVCEKPLSLKVEEADELLALAESRKLLCVTNLMQRYNPLYEGVRRLIQSGVLGECLRGSFDNAAGDEGLGPDHWFWDSAKSGGIFIEHGVHFFDLFEGWLGTGRVIAGHRTLRPVGGMEEQVQCTVRYPSGALVDFHHGFTQPGRLDRQEFRLLFEHGDLLLEEWVPVRARIRAAVNEEQTRRLTEFFPGGRLDVLEGYGGSGRAARGRHRHWDFSQKIELHAGGGDEKMRRYCELLRAIFADQCTWLSDHAHVRKVTERNGRASLALAEAATELAAAGE
jgi:predicted dehydrogenase